MRAYQYDAYDPIDINRVGRISKTDSRLTYYQQLLNDSDAALDDAKINALRKRVHEMLARTIGEHQVVKTHNARLKVDGFSLVSGEYTRKAVYIVRNPLDVVDSLADHCNLSLDEAVERLSDPYHTFGNPSGEFVRQYLSTWSNHVVSWIESPDFPVLLIRYEDLIARPLSEFTRLIQFLEWRFDDERIARAASLTSFSILQETEIKQGFGEVSPESRNGKFFRTGKSGQWKNILSAGQRDHVIADHHEVMQQLRYLPTDNITNN